MRSERATAKLPFDIAKILTVPEKVTPSNILEMRERVLNGPNHVFGAQSIITSEGDLVSLASCKNRQSIILRYGWVLERHLKDDDYVIFNRQPTLHKPGIMAHTARVLKGERVIRMHYANCNTYNADFDGDEMNLHLCQNELGRAEGMHIASTDRQYIVPTNGKPLRGLIQDHVVMGVLLTKRDTFVDRAQYTQLIALANMPLRRGENVRLLPPTILKPVPLWTGKQVISSLLLHLHPEAHRLSLTAASKTSPTAWDVVNGKKELAEEAEVVVRRGELLSGVLDKAAFGASEFGLVHAVHEALGGEAAGSLLSQLGRLLTGYLQIHGFTCGIEDLLLTAEADAERRARLGAAVGVGEGVLRDFAEAAADAPAAEVESIIRAKLRGSGAAGAAAEAALDGAMKTALMPIGSDAVAKCLPAGQRVRFPHKAGKIGYQQLNRLALAKCFSCIFGPHFTYEPVPLTAYTICNVNYILLLMRCWRLRGNLPTH